MARIAVIMEGHSFRQGAAYARLRAALGARWPHQGWKGAFHAPCERGLPIAPAPARARASFEQRERRGMARRKYVVGNWKMNGLSDAMSEAQAIFSAADRASVGRCRDLPALHADRRDGRRRAGQAIGGQDCHSATSGAFTGSVAAPMLADIGASVVIVGHSERREGFGESDADVRAKAEAGLAAGLSVILCVRRTARNSRIGRCDRLCARADCGIGARRASMRTDSPSPMNRSGRSGPALSPRSRMSRRCMARSAARLRRVLAARPGYAHSLWRVGQWRQCRRTARRGRCRWRAGRRCEPDRSEIRADHRRADALG
jgi:hypothetical protein